MEFMIPSYVIEENPELFPDFYGQFINIDTTIRPRGAILAFLGKIAVTVVGGVITHCIITQWGESNACHRALHWRSYAPVPKNYHGILNYKVFGKFTPGRVPGFEPIHSRPCNSGYWTVRYEKI